MATITDLNGKIIQQQNVTPGVQYVDISRIATGIYILRLTGNHDMQSLKFVKD